MPEAKSDITVHVRFPLKGKPFKQSFPATATLDVVKARALVHFEIVEDGQTEYYFTFDNVKQSGGAVLSVLAGHAASVELYLVKQTISG